jgi:hypothetical protein
MSQHAQSQRNGDDVLALAVPDRFAMRFADTPKQYNAARYNAGRSSQGNLYL